MVQFNPIIGLGFNWIELKKDGMKIDGENIQDLFEDWWWKKKTLKKFKCDKTQFHISFTYE